MQPLFWVKKDRAEILISLDHHIDETGSEIFSFVPSRALGNSRGKFCQFKQEVPGAYRLVEGNNAPWVYFFIETIDGEYKKGFSVFPFNTVTCKMADGVHFKDVRHPVLKVFALESSGAIAAQLDHPLENLFWNSERGCEFFNMGESEL
jgi:hypothetical protein